MDLFTKYATRNQQFCLVLDEMDHLFADSELLTDFLLVLRKWKMSTKHFRGFQSLQRKIMEYSGGVRFTDPMHG